MRLVLLAAAAVTGWLVWRRRRQGGPRIVVAWQDGGELVLPPKRPEHARLVSLAERVLE